MPKVIIISCAADVSHAQKITGIDNPVRGKDYLEIATPGACPNEESLKTIEQLALRFTVERIVVITHEECGLVIALQKKYLDPTGTPGLFANEANAVDVAITENRQGKELANNELDTISHSLCKTIVSTVANSLLENSEAKAPEHLNVLENIVIEGYYSNDTDHDLRQVVDPINIGNFVNIG